MKQSHRTLVKPTFLSLGGHLLLFLPFFCMGGLPAQVRTDVIRGLSSIELEFVPSQQESKRHDLKGEEEVETPHEKKVRHPAPVPQEAWLHDGGALMRRISMGLRNPAPRYPLQARIQGWQGTVFVRALVVPSGRVASLQVRQSSGYPLLDGAALDALREWRFLPARKEGQELAQWVEIPITFKLDPGDQDQSEHS